MNMCKNIKHLINTYVYDINSILRIIIIIISNNINTHLNLYIILILIVF